MKVSYSKGEFPASSQIVATPGELDAFPPVSILRMDGAPQALSSDRLAVAGTLAFAPWISGQLIFEQQISALTAKTISDFFPTRWVHVSPLHPANLPIPRGRRAVGLVTENDHAVSRHSTSLRIRPRHEASGIRVESDSIVIASNAFSLSGSTRDQLQGLGPYLAVAVIFAEDFGIDRISIPESIRVDEERFHRLRNLMSCVGLGVAQ